MSTPHKLNDILCSFKLSYAELNKIVQAVKFTREMRKTTDDISGLSGLKILIKDLDVMLEEARDFFSNNRNTEQPAKDAEKKSGSNPQSCTSRK
tara:strand:- start:19182 stop:19463 length:282 start_codon:yes stop_codon:yes gene_type:complete